MTRAGRRYGARCPRPWLYLRGPPEGRTAPVTNWRVAKLAIQPPAFGLLRHQHGIDDVDHAVRCCDIGCDDGRAVDLDA